MEKMWISSSSRDNISSYTCTQPKITQRSAESEVTQPRCILWRAPCPKTPQNLWLCPGWCWSCAGKGLLCQEMALDLHGAARGAGASRSVPAASAPQLAPKPFPGIPRVLGLIRSTSGMLYPHPECPGIPSSPYSTRADQAEWIPHFQIYTKATFLFFLPAAFHSLKASFPEEKKK